MTVHANEILAKYYQLQRQTDQRNQARTTIRLLESLVRLSQGHARLMMRDTVHIVDAITAITLMESSMYGTSLISGINPLHTSFPKSPNDQYKQQLKIILEKLQLMKLYQYGIMNFQSTSQINVNSGSPNVVSKEDDNHQINGIERNSSTGSSNPDEEVSLSLDNITEQCSNTENFDKTLDYNEISINSSSKPSVKDNSSKPTSSSKRKLFNGNVSPTFHIHSTAQNIIEELDDDSPPAIPNKRKRLKYNFKISSTKKKNIDNSPTTNSDEVSSISADTSLDNSSQSEIIQESLNKENNLKQIKSLSTKKDKTTSIFQKLNKFRCVNDDDDILSQKDLFDDHVTPSPKNQLTSRRPAYPLSPVIIQDQLGPTINNTPSTCNNNFQQKNTSIFTNKNKFADDNDDDDFDFFS